MKVTLTGNKLTVMREPGDKRQPTESAFFHALKKELNASGHDLIKKVMSKADIENVCTLAAHLARIEETVDTGIGAYQQHVASVGQSVRDAMKLQRLGRRACRNAERYCSEPGYEDRYEPEKARIERQAAEILTPYGLKAQVTGDPRGYCLKIMGLPGNTWGGDEAGFGI